MIYCIHIYTYVITITSNQTQKGDSAKVHMVNMYLCNIKRIQNLITFPRIVDIARATCFAINSNLELYSSLRGTKSDNRLIYNYGQKHKYALYIYN